MHRLFCVLYSRLEILGDKMKKLILAGVFGVAASTAMAGSISDPVIEAPIIVEEATSSSSGIAVPLILLAALLTSLTN